MSTNTITHLNGRTDLPIIKHEQFKEYLALNFSLDEKSIQMLDEILIKLVTLVIDVKWLARQVETLEAKPLCNGTMHEAYDNEGYWKVNHGVGVACPMHGRPRQANGRLRIGIGRDAHEISRVETAIDDYTKLQSLKRRLEENEAALSSLQRRLMGSIGIYR